MEYQKIVNLLGNTSNQPPRFRKKNWVKINDDRNGIYDKTFKTAILNSSLCDYGDAYILIERKITAVGQGANAAEIAADGNDKKVVFKNCAPFIKCNNAEVDNTEKNTVKIMQKHQLVYGSIVETNQMIT